MTRLWLTIIIIILFFLGLAGNLFFEIAAAGGGNYHDSGNSGIIIYSIILGLVYIFLFIVLGKKGTKEDNVDDE